VSTSAPEPLPPRLPGPLRVVLDSCVFPRRTWMDPILDSARAGHIRLFWSPSIISEVNRLLTWLWLENHGGRLTDASWRQCSLTAKAWFGHMTRVFHVVEDCPPHESPWTLVPRDEDDAPIWTTAVRARAHVVITENLKDGPPANDEGLHLYQGILYVHPNDFCHLLPWLGDLNETGVDWKLGEDDLGETAAATASSRTTPVQPPPELWSAIRDLLLRTEQDTSL